MGGDAGRPSVLDSGSEFSRIMQGTAKLIWEKLELLAETPRLKVEN